MEVSQVIGLFESAVARQSTMEKASAPKKKLEAFPIFRIPLRPILNLTTCPFSSAARKPIFVAIPSDLPRKKGAMMRKLNVSHVTTMKDKMVRRRELPCVRRLNPLYRGSVVHGAVPKSMERKK
jgi:hypothetical protein